MKFRVIFSSIQYTLFLGLISYFTIYYLSLSTFENQITTTDISDQDWSCKGKGNAFGSFSTEVALQSKADCSKPFNINSLNETGIPTGCFKCTITYGFPWKDKEDCKVRLNLSKIPYSDEESSIPFTSDVSFRRGDGLEGDFQIFLIMPDYPWLRTMCTIPFIIPERITELMMKNEELNTSYSVSLQEFVTGECFNRRGGSSVCSDSQDDYTGKYKVFNLRAWDDKNMEWVASEKIMQAPSAISPTFMREIDPAFEKIDPLNFSKLCDNIPIPAPFECSRVKKKGFLEAVSIAFGTTGIIYGFVSYVLETVFSQFFSEKEPQNCNVL